jgi:hypothetical protein
MVELSRHCLITPGWYHSFFLLVTLPDRLILMFVGWIGTKSK